MKIFYSNKDNRLGSFLFLPCKVRIHVVGFWASGDIYIGSMSICTSERNSGKESFEYFFVAHLDFCFVIVVFSYNNQFTLSGRLNFGLRIFIFFYLVMC